MLLLVLVFFAVSSSGGLIMIRMTGICQKPIQEHIHKQIEPAAAFPLEQITDQGKTALRSKPCEEGGGKPWCSVRLGDPLKGLIS